MVEDIFPGIFLGRGRGQCSLPQPWVAGFPAAGAGGEALPAARSAALNSLGKTAPTRYTVITMIRENPAGAYLGPTASLAAHWRLDVATPNFDVLANDTARVILGKCSRLPDDEDLAAGRFGIDFHRALPPFQGDSGFTCDWGDGPIPVNAQTYARFLPRTIRFRQFTANVAFAAATPAAYVAKRQVYEEFYRQVYDAPEPLVVAVPHCGPVYRPPDDYHPFPESEIDAWTARVAVRLQPGVLSKRLLLSLHSTDYFGALLDLGDFGLPGNHVLPALAARLNEEFRQELAALTPAYRDHILLTTRERLAWKHERWGTLHPEALASLSTASQFEVKILDGFAREFLPEAERFTFAGLCRGLEAYWAAGRQVQVTVNGVFSGRKTAKLLNLAANLRQAGLAGAVQVEVSRFLAHQDPELAAAMISRLLELLAPRLP